MQCQILLVIHKPTEDNLEEESGKFSEVTMGFFSRHPDIPLKYMKLISGLSTELNRVVMSKEWPWKRGITNYDELWWVKNK